MRILHVLSADFFAGSVSYAVHLAEAHRAQGHEVVMVSDMDQLPTGALCVQAPITNRRHPQRLRNILLLRRLLREHRIEVVHAHSRAASWVAYFAVKGTGVPLVSTVHGRQHLHTSTSLFDIYGDKVVAICANLKTHLVEEVKMQPEKIVLLPNGVNFADQAPELATQVRPLRLSFIGRFNGGKGERAAQLLQHVFPALLREFAVLRVALVGAELEQLPAAGKAALAQLQAEFGERVEVVGFTQDVPQWLRQSALVVGAGRVAIEALGAACSVLALGEAAYAGLVTEANYEQAAASNFGDISARLQPTTVDYNELLQDARTFLTAPHPAGAALQARVQRDYTLPAVAAQVLEVYRGAMMQKRVPGFIPILMYHKIPLEPLPTKHRIFVTRDNFEQHLQFFQRRGFTPITFLDYLAFANGERDLQEFPARPLILTFDDGYTDNFTNLLPLMQRYGYRGVLYLLGDEQVRYNFWDVDSDPTEPRCEIMSLEQKQAFVAAGWEIGAHTLRHPNLTTLPAEQAAQEITVSKQQLEQQLKTQVVSFAYPYGGLNEEVKQLVSHAGFAFGVATDTGGLHLEDDRFQIFRVNMFPEETTSTLFKKTASWYRKYYRFKRKK
ncbi:polysaccharide deacetylase family protein [Hymenobacter cellulosilyticus]|uniref:Polysaccharide deacetylase family protein n=1 Tax=Hymenobacter cellulosilyticus TaxID=2932248 RepID=A0A8T9QEQ7_9BACT|nr:polysaccharide deacetylase family protein [Hymenobacter cellulosilyticus]UOQ74310.1 polysaccharide deacetylase family protein [Hymenobacter cellulosilyticus]